ncbi:enoyl-CoA hydratase/isomerase family protein [Vulgatibacter sp.]|uniref:enoyl-CoA hydratase/isomerase family protein n=1 Tax=Vulgatibacter sp. TaxID=1971226 RepID=UPI003561BF5F
MGLLQVDRVGEDVRVLTLDNERKRNAVDPDLLGAIVSACEEANAAQVRCLVLTGRGDKAFCAGYDLEALARTRPDDPLPDAALQVALSALEHAQAPVIAAINGAAYGAGAELSVACDLRIAAAGARIAMPPAKLGIIYAPAGLQRFVELLGLSQAKRLFYTAEPVEAAEARSIGLVDEVVEPGRALDRALELAASIAANSPVSVQGMKRLFLLLRRRELQPAVMAEVEALRRASFHCEDAREGIAAVRERRKPHFTGR